jgi:phosphodiesterase/alkaline phosphatase D-like protein
MQRTILPKLIAILAFFLCYTVAQDVSIVVGPVIGKVTNSTARVLFEFDNNATITVTLTDPSGNTVNTTKNVTGGLAVVFAFSGLQAETKYTVSLNDSVTNMIESYFTTLGGPTGNLNFAVSSCMDRFVQADKEDKADLWADLLKRVQNNEVQYLLQTGDQLYMDDPFGNPTTAKPYYACQQILNQTSRDEWDSKKPEMIELLRNEFRQTWTIPSVRETLAKIPSLTIFDDHEVRDDWGYIDTDSDPTSQDFYYGLLARQVIYEYERQLREDVDFTNLTNITTDYYAETLNGIGFYFMDYRGIRTWNRNYSQMNGMQIGETQWAYLDQLLEPTNGTFADVKSFFLVSPLTVIFLVEAFVEIGYFSNNDAQESWSFGYLDEQARLLNLLRNWKLGRDGRELVILDGDVHMGGFTDIKYDDDFAYLQFTTSSIASSAPGDATFLAFDLLKEVQKLNDPWSYEHHDWTNDFNYGIVLAKSQDNQANVQCFMVKADDSDEPEMVDSDGSDVSSDDWDDILSGNN